jgi:hypothetical protein
MTHLKHVLSVRVTDLVVGLGPYDTNTRHVRGAHVSHY